MVIMGTTSTLGSKGVMVTLVSTRPGSKEGVAMPRSTAIVGAVTMVTMVTMVYWGTLDTKVPSVLTVAKGATGRAPWNATS